MNTKFVNSTNSNLRNPFDHIRPYNGNLPKYMFDLTTELCHYAADIKQDINIKIDGENIEITVAFS